MSDDRPLLIFDVESIGLHGEGFAVGLVVVEPKKLVTFEAGFACDPAFAEGSDEGRRWVIENVESLEGDDSIIYVGSPRDVRAGFWEVWAAWKEQDAWLMADCSWPVEARFLSDCVKDDTSREQDGPYPLLDAMTLRTFKLAAPTEDKHHPVKDALATLESVKEVWETWRK